MKKNIFSFENFFKYITVIIDTITIKNQKEADKYETIQSINSFEKYRTCLDKSDRFEYYDKFDKETLRKAGISEDMIDYYYYHVNEIPFEYREKILEYNRQKVINEYIEINTYYRTLIGLPAVDDIEFIYISNIDFPDLNIDYNTPIHLFSNETIGYLETEGVLSKIQSEYGEKKYLKFLGRNKVNLRLAREASDYDLITFKTSGNDIINTAFKTYYIKNKEYFMKTMYNYYYDTEYDLYSNFVQFFIVFMTIQSVLIENVNILISRDFYDKRLLDLFLEKFNLEFIKELPIQYRNKIIKNLNYLLLYKGSDQVIFDICDLFGFKDIKLYRNYLKKKYKVDSEGVPVIKYLKDENGKVLIDSETGEPVEDILNMYDLKMLKVPVGRNEDIYLKDESNVINYDHVTQSDKYWGGDEEPETLKQEILKKQFNNARTKYMSLNSMYDMAAMNFECAYYFKMIMDLKDKIQFDVHLNNVYEKDLTIFETITMLFYLTCKLFGYKGNIISDPLKITAVKGFNFRANRDMLFELIKESGLNIDADSLNIDKIFNSKDEINSIFFKNRTIYYTILKALKETDDINEYRVLKKLHDCMCYSEYQPEIYKKKDGTVARTYGELLQDLNAELYVKLTKIEEAELQEVIENILYDLETQLGDESFTFIFSNISTLLLDNLKYYMFKVINFFKSYTVDLYEMNIIYTFDDPYLYYIKVLEDFEFIASSFEDKEGLKLNGMVKHILSKFDISDDKIEFTEIIDKVFNLIITETKIEEKEECDFQIYRGVEQKIKFLIEQDFIVNESFKEFLFNLYDKIIVSDNFEKSLNISVVEELITHVIQELDEKLTVSEKIDKILNILPFDFTISEEEKHYIENQYTMKDEIEYNSELLTTMYEGMKELLKIHLDVEFISNQHLKDSIVDFRDKLQTIRTNLIESNKIDLHDSLSQNMYENINDLLFIIDHSLTIVNLQPSDNISIEEYVSLS